MGLSDVKRKVFFFEKKKQKTFAHWLARPMSKWAAYAK
jgi:ribonuclease D